MHKEFQSEDTFHIKGVGKVFAVAFEPTPAGEVRALNGQEVVIDGARYRVKGVETYAVPSDTKVRNAGLAVTPVCQYCGKTDECDCYGKLV